ncbi:MAG TPA: ATP-binding protein, partial [Candidatus Xenobia bacterium]
PFHFRSCFVFPYLSKEGGDAWHVILVPLTRGGIPVGYIQAAAPWQPSLDLLEAFAGYLVLGTVLASGLGILVAFWLANLLTDPLRRLARVTRQVADGNLSARTELGSGGNEIYAVAHDFDQMVAQVEDAFATQKRFVADASHELKTPLTAIGGMAELLRLGMDQGQEDKRQRALQTIETQVARMNRMVGDLLTLSSAEQQSDVARESVVLQSILEEAQKHAALLGAEHEFSARLGDDRATVHGNYDRLLRVLNNLLDNAFKYTPPGGQVTLSSRREGSQVVIAVQDNGVGIAPEDLPHVFERFYRADPSRTRKTGGTGLGLSIVSAIVEAHRGTVRISSTPGQGTTVEVRLPLVL